MSGRPVVVALLAASVAAACGTARRGVPFTGEHTPPTEQVTLGQRVFAANCNGCHPGGTQGLGPALNNKPLPGWAIRFQVRNGLGAMPSFSSEEIDGEQLDALVSYLVWLRRLPVRGLQSPAAP